MSVCAAPSNNWFNWPTIPSLLTIRLYPKTERNMKTITIIVTAALACLGSMLAQTQQAVQLAQAAASTTPGPPVAGQAPPGTPGGPGMFQQRLQQIVNRGHGNPGRTLVIRTSDTDAKTQGNLEEDLAVM